MPPKDPTIEEAKAFRGRQRTHKRPGISPSPSVLDHPPSRMMTTEKIERDVHPLPPQAARDAHSSAGCLSSSSPVPLRCHHPPPGLAFGEPRGRSMTTERRVRKMTVESA
jgi:hypothetical protein